MKKVLAVMAIMLVIVGAVFAAETHTIKIKADVSEVIPAFQLNLLAPAETYTTNTTPNVYSASGSYGDLTNLTAKDTNFNLDNGGDVYVNVVLANLAKTVGVYTLSFGGGTFAVNRNSVGGSLAPVITTAAGSVTTGISSIAKASEAAGADVNVTFNGTTVTADSPVVATATYAYTGDTTIDPGTYYADITLTITV